MDSGKPHKRIRSTCKHCKQKAHDRDPKVGNTARFHGDYSFCRTHHADGPRVTKKYSRKYKKYCGLGGRRAPAHHYKSKRWREKNYTERERTVFNRL